jgi:crossover junction endodeoxyribonuclease RusA
MRLRYVGGRPYITPANPHLTGWRTKLARAARTYKGTTPRLTGPILIRLTFYMPRPAHHIAPDGSVFANAAATPCRKPDLDKLVRAVFDALTDAEVWGDDGQAVAVEARKVWADPSTQPGAQIELEPVEA